MSFDRIATPDGPVQTVLTVTGISTAGLSSTMHVRITSDGTGQIGLTGSLVSSTELGARTVIKENDNCIILFNTWLTLNL